ncbi:MAG: arginine--tRNA ligase [Firmicutes bacterium]|nr:arginine--tRNA ligase [Bacillota bacterium]
MITEILSELLTGVAHKIGYEKEFTVILSNRPELCDYQSDTSFQLAKAYHKSPMVIGTEMVDAINQLEDFQDYFQEVSFAAPGFINMTLSDTCIMNKLKDMMNHDKFHIKMPDRIETFVLDYGGPNVAKPLHVGHMRTAIVGESIKRIIQYMGHKTIADVHLGDYGLQIGQVIYGVLQSGKTKDEITLEYLEEIYPKMSALCKEDDTVKEACANITKSLQDGEPTYRELWKVILEISGNDIKRLYQYLGVSFDLWQGESDAYQYIEPTEKLLKEKNLIEESEGALIVPVKEEDDAVEMPPLIWQKSNGAYLYGTTDLATIYEREMRFHPDHICYVVDNRQGLHFEQVFRVAKKAELTGAGLEFLGYGTVNGEDGKPYKTRSGDTPKLDGLFTQTKDIFLSKKEENKDKTEEDIDKIVNAILKFADLQNSRDRDYIFDIQKFSNTVGKTGPYILYTYLRIQKILDQASLKEPVTSTIYNEVDRNLRLKLLELDKVMVAAFTERKPNYIADYIYHLADLANSFYQSNHIVGLEDKTKKNDWLYLLTLTNRVLKEMLYLIGIEIPTFM